MRKLFTIMLTMVMLFAITAFIVGCDNGEPVVEIPTPTPEPVVEETSEPIPEIADNINPEIDFETCPETGYLIYPNARYVVDTFNRSVHHPIYYDYDGVYFDEGGLFYIYEHPVRGIMRLKVTDEMTLHIDTPTHIDIFGEIITLENIDWYSDERLRDVHGLQAIRDSAGDSFTTDRTGDPLVGIWREIDGDMVVSFNVNSTGHIENLRPWFSERFTKELEELDFAWFPHYEFNSYSLFIELEEGLFPERDWVGVIPWMDIPFHSFEENDVISILWNTASNNAQYRIRYERVG